MPEKKPAKKPPAHKAKLVELEDDEQFLMAYGGKFVIKCSCGWQSSPRSSEERARREHAQHVEAGS